MNKAGLPRNESLISGLAGAVALTAAHQAAKAVTPNAPRMDVVGMRALVRGADHADLSLPETHKGLYRAALAGDLICNTAYYSLATNYTRGAAMGLLAGIGALVLPQRIGLGAPPRSELLSNQVMTVAWYLLGGLVAATASTWLANRHGDSRATLPAPSETPVTP